MVFDSVVFRSPASAFGGAERFKTLVPDADVKGQRKLMQEFVSELSEFRCGNDAKKVASSVRAVLAHRTRKYSLKGFSES